MRSIVPMLLVCACGAAPDVPTPSCAAPNSGDAYPLSFVASWPSTFRPLSAAGLMPASPVVRASVRNAATNDASGFTELIVRFANCEGEFIGGQTIDVGAGVSPGEWIDVSADLSIVAGDQFVLVASPLGAGRIDVDVEGFRLE